MAIFESRIGLDITREKLQMVELTFEGEEYKLHNLDQTYFDEPLDLKTEKETKIHSILQSAFDEILLRNKITTNKTAVTLPVDLFFINQLPYDNTLLQHDLIEEFRWEYSVLYPHMNIDELVFQFYEISKNIIIPNSTAIVAAINRKYLNLVHTFTKKNNLELKFIDNTHFAFDKAIYFSRPNSLDETVLSLFLSDKILSIEILIDGRPIFYKSLHFTSAKEIPELIEQTLVASPQFNIKKEYITEAYLGGENTTESLMDALSERIGIKITKLNPFENLTVSDITAKTRYYKDKSFIFGAAAGISFRLN
jgi:Tfp pilus assembly PilM family ATPase